MNLATILTRHAGGDASGKSAVILGDRSLTYRELDRASARVAGLLAGHGIEAGDRVGLMLPNVPEFAAIYFGALRAGAAVVPMNPLLKAREVAYYLKDSGAEVLVAWGDTTGEAVEGAARAGTRLVEVSDTFLDTLDATEATEAVAPREGSDPAVILYTSGTTGRPKGAELTHASLLRNQEVVGGSLLRLTADDTVFGGLPLFHSFGQTVTLNATIATGGTLVMLSRFTPADAVGVMARHRVTVFCGVPTMYSALLALPEPPALNALRLSISGGSAMPVEVLRRFEDQFTCIVLEGYGLSETSPVASFNHADRLRKPGSIGGPIEGVEMRVVDEAGKELPDDEVGEIAIRGHNVMRGYWNNPEATAAVLSADGWFRTGDMGRRDADGLYFIVDRKKDMIIRGGFNVYPREIEEIFYEHPAVSEAAVIGIPHPELGEEIAAFVALVPGVTASSDELQAHVKHQVAPYKYPRHVYVVDSLPKGPTGKILKREIQPPAPERTTASAEPGTTR